MGFCYDIRGRMCCDRCGLSGGVRKRTCKYKVLSDSLYGPRQSLPYCPPPALCSACYRALGGIRIHDGCKEPAAASQADADAIEAVLDSGDLLSTTAFGDWHNEVPAGMVGLRFTGRTQHSVWRLARSEDYPNRRVALSEIDTVDWERASIAN